MLKVDYFFHLKLNQPNKINVSLVGYLFLSLGFLFLSDKALSNDNNIKNSINGRKRFREGGALEKKSQEKKCSRAVKR